MKREKRQKLILKSCRSLFSQKGYLKSNVSQLVEHAGVSRGTFYLYFKNKQQVFEAVLKDMSLELQKILNQQGQLFDETTALSLADSLHAYCVEYGEFASYLNFDYFRLPASEKLALQQQLSSVHKIFSQKILMALGHLDSEPEITLLCWAVFKEFLQGATRASFTERKPFMVSVLSKTLHQVSTWSADSSRKLSAAS